MLHNGKRMHQVMDNFLIRKIYLFGIMVVVAVLAGCANNAEKPNAVHEQKREKTPSAPNTAKAKTIVFYGNSLTAGYGVDPSEAFPALVQNKIDSLQLPFKVVNAGLSGETTAGGRSRIDWILRQPVNVFVLELGGNDGLRGIPISATAGNLQGIIDRVKAKYPDATIILAGMQIPPNMGRKYTTAFREVFQQLASKNNITLIPFLLEHVGGIATLNQADGIHPNPEGHKIVAENVWKVLQTVL